VSVDERLNFLFVVVLLLNFLMLGTSRMGALVQCAAAQGVLLGAAYLALHGASGPRALVLGLAIAGIKGVLIPRILLGALRSQPIRREVEPFVSFTVSLLLGGLATGLAILFAESLPLRAAEGGALLVPASFATVLTGFLVLTTRRKALTQVVGFLMLENGLALLAVLGTYGIPLIVELGVFLDVLMGFLVMQIFIYQIHETFESIDVEQLTRLRH